MSPFAANPIYRTCPECKGWKSYGSKTCKPCAVEAQRGAFRTRPFDELVDRSAGLFGCWTWLGNINDHGYGRYRLGGRNVYAHRYSLERALGRPLGPDMCACHHCDNPPCVRPDHLFEGTQRDNQMDAVAKSRHVRGVNSPVAKLTSTEVRTIRALGSPITHLIPQFPHVSPRTLYRVRAGDTYGDIA